MTDSGAVTTSSLSTVNTNPLTAATSLSTTSTTSSVTTSITSPVTSTTTLATPVTVIGTVDLSQTARVTSPTSETSPAVHISIAEHGASTASSDDMMSLMEGDGLEMDFKMKTSSIAEKFSKQVSTVFGLFTNMKPRGYLYIFGVLFLHFR